MSIMFVEKYESFTFETFVYDIFVVLSNNFEIFITFFLNNMFNHCTNENDRFVDKFRKSTFRRLFFFQNSNHS